MKNISTTLFFIIFIGLILGIFSHLIYGHCQTSKFHFILQEYYMREYLPNWMQKKMNLDDYGGIKVDVNYSGKWNRWYRNWVKQSESEYINGQLNGKTITWYENGVKETEYVYKDDKLNGKRINWWITGVKYIEAEYNEGKLNGKTVKWYNTGEKLSEYEYYDGKLNGKKIQWSRSGAKQSESEFKDGVLMWTYPR